MVKEEEISNDFKFEMIQFKSIRTLDKTIIYIIRITIVFK